MNIVAVHGDKRMTLKEVAGATGAAYSTVAEYAQRAGWTKNGKKTLLDERQVTLILEAMKQAQPNQTKDTFQASIEGIETSQSRAVRIALLAKKQHAIDLQIQAEMRAEINELQTENLTLQVNLQATQHLLTEREVGLSAIQRIAEAGGLMLSDRDDVLATYRRR